MQLLFIGPFRYAPNLEGILRFLDEVYPTIKTAVPTCGFSCWVVTTPSPLLHATLRLRSRALKCSPHRDDVAGTARTTAR